MSNQSVQSDILDLAVAALPGAFRCRFRDFGPAELPARNVVPESEDTEYNDTSSVDRTFRFTVRHTVSAVDAVDKAADAQYVLTASQLAGYQPFREAIRNLREVKRKWESERGELQQMTLSVTYEVQFGTDTNDPSVAIF